MADFVITFAPAFIVAFSSVCSYSWIKIKYHNFGYELFLDSRIRVFALQDKKVLIFRKPLPVSQSNAYFISMEKQIGTLYET